MLLMRLLENKIIKTIFSLTHYKKFYLDYLYVFRTHFRLKKWYSKRWKVSICMNHFTSSLITCHQWRHLMFLSYNGYNRVAIPGLWFGTITYLKTGFPEKIWSFVCISEHLSNKMGKFSTYFSPLHVVSLGNPFLDLSCSIFPFTNSLYDHSKPPLVLFSKNTIKNWNENSPFNALFFLKVQSKF